MSNEAIQPLPPQESSTQAQIAAAQRYAQEHGYTTDADGWIFNTTGRRIAHDWQTFTSYLVVMGVKAVRNATEES